MRCDGREVATTADHPFWNETDNEWQRADTLNAGHRLLTADGGSLPIDGMNWASARLSTAYNLTVAGIHTYFVAVGAEQVLVHNRCGGLTPGGGFDGTPGSSPALTNNPWNPDAVAARSADNAALYSDLSTDVADNLGMSVSEFVAQTRQGSIWRRLPGEVADMTVGDALEHSSTVRKLLTSNEYLKWTEHWYSVSVDMVVLVEQLGLTDRWTSVLLLRASDPARAIESAVGWGRQQETVYKNRYGEKVRWGLEAVRTVDELDDLRGVTEVYTSVTTDMAADSLDFDAVLNPTANRVRESGVGVQRRTAEESGDG